jgi:DNA-binding transcriptional MocR family regulator
LANINFLRGVPADEALVPVAQALSDAYSKVFADFGGKIIQYGSPGLTDFLGYNGLKVTLGKRFGAAGDPLKQVICTNGGMETFSFVLKALPRGSKVAADAICYDRVLIDIERHEHETIGVPLQEDGADLDALKHVLESGDIEIYYQVGYHHNPLGNTISKANMEGASELCARYNVLHVVDIAYFELRYDGHRNQLLSSLTEYPETTSVVGSFTKTLSPGAKCGFGVFPEPWVERLFPVISNTRLNPNYPTQAAIDELFKNGFYDKNLDYLVGLYGPRMEAANKAMAEYLPDLQVPKLTGGFFVGLWVKGVHDAAKFVAAVKEKGATIATAKLFAPGFEEKLREEKDGVFFRLTFPAYTAEENEAGIKAIADAYNEMT